MFFVTYIIRDFLINTVAALHIVPRALRSFLYLVAGMNIRTQKIRPGVLFETNEVSIGKGSFINYNCIFTGPVIIGQNCSLAYEVMLCTTTHDIGRAKKRAGRAYEKPIVIKDGCWLGARVTVLPGVTIGEGCIVAAGSVVIKDCEPHGLYIGVPAKRVKDLKV